MKRLLCLWLPDWPAQRARKALDLQRSKSPLVLAGRDPRRGEIVAACDAGALAAGVRRGLPLAEATALARRSTKSGPLRIAPYDPAADRAALEELALVCERYSPLVGLGEAFPRPADQTAPAYDCLLLDVTSIGLLFGGERQLAAALLADLAALGYEACAAVADTVAAAWGLAHFPPVDRVEIADSGWERLQSLPLAALRIAPASAATLHELGITTVEQLAALPHAALASRLGVELVRQLDRALGVVDELIEPVRPAPQYQAQWLLEHPTADRAVLAMILEQLAERVGAALRLADQGAVQLVCRLDLAQSAPRTLEIGLFRPTADARHFVELLKLQSEALQLQGAVGRVGLAAVTTARLEHRQQELFAAALSDQSESLALLINRLSNRLGRERVGRPELTRDAVPERAWQLAPLTANAAPTAATTKSKPRSKRTLAQQAARRMTISLLDESSPVAPLRTSATRPLTLLEPPRPLEVVAVAPQGPPVQFLVRGQRQRVVRHWGPERIETAWWRGASVRRDYYRVETESGERYWIFRELRDWKWFLHGAFG